MAMVCLFFLVSVHAHQRQQNSRSPSHRRRNDMCFCVCLCFCLATRPEEERGRSSLNVISFFERHQLDLHHRRRSAIFGFVLVYFLFAHLFFVTLRDHSTLRRRHRHLQARVYGHPPSEFVPCHFHLHSFINLSSTLFQLLLLLMMMMVMWS